MNRIRSILAAIALTLGLGVSLVGLQLTTASAAVCNDGPKCAQNGLNAVNDGNSKDLPGKIKTVINVLLFVIGAVAVIMIIVGGFRYVVSAGDQSSVTAAKNTIFYAVIGLVIAILAFAIVNFVVSNL